MKRIVRRWAVVSCWLLVGVWVLWGMEAGEAARKRMLPNVIVIVADDLGFGDIGVYGQRRFQTPQLDQFAAEGMRFTGYYAGSSIGRASRGALLTGLHTGHSRIRGRGARALALEDATLGELAKKAGYRTCAIGKWGLGGPGSSGLPTVQGFDEWFGYLDDESVTNHFPSTLWRNQTRILFSENLSEQAQYAPYLFTNAATNFVAGKAVPLNQQEPFFLYIAYTLPHAPLQSPTDKPYQSKDWPKPQKTLAAMIYRLDRAVGRILGALRHFQLDKRTVVFFTSDNGPHAEEGIDPSFFDSTGGLRGRKGSLFEGGIRVPLLARWPGQIRDGVVSDHLCAAWDLFPTVADIMGIKTRENIDGISFLPTLLNRRQRRHDYLYWEIHEAGHFARAIRRGHWKGIQTGVRQPLQLFHLGRDPAETIDLADRYSRTARRLERYLNDARTESFDWPLPLQED